MPKLDLSTVPVKTGSIYPSPYAEMMAGRSSLRLGQAAGLTQFGVNLVRLEPGAVSSLRHWHRAEDEFVMALSGQLVLVQDEGEIPMVPGDCAGWPAGDENGHCLRNDGAEVATFLVIGSKAAQEVCTYSDHDLILHTSPGENGRADFTYKDGTVWKGAR